MRRFQDRLEQFVAVLDQAARRHRHVRMHAHEFLAQFAVETAHDSNNHDEHPHTDCDPR